MNPICLLYYGLQSPKKMVIPLEKKNDVRKHVTIYLEF